MRIGEYLQGRSLITEEELQAALSDQQACMSHCFLGDILVDKEILSKEDFEKYLTEFLVLKGETLDACESHLGDLLISSELLTKKQLDDCLQLQKQADDGIMLGEVLIDQGYLSTDDLVNFLSNQRIIRSVGDSSEE